MKLNKTTTIKLSLVLLVAGGAPAFAQSYTMPGNDPVREHTHLGDRPIDCRKGGSLVYRDAFGRIRIAPAERACRHRHG